MHHLNGPCRMCALYDGITGREPGSAARSCDVTARAVPAVSPLVGPSTTQESPLTPQQPKPDVCSVRRLTGGEPGSAAMLTDAAAALSSSHHIAASTCEAASAALNAGASVEHVGVSRRAAAALSSSHHIAASTCEFASAALTAGASVERVGVSCRAAAALSSSHHTAASTAIIPQQAHAMLIAPP